MRGPVKLGFGIGMFGIAAPLYLIPNHFPLLPPVELPLTAIDRLIPFVPETIWIYLSEYPLVISAYALTRDSATLTRYLKSTLALLVFSAVIFVLFPTTYPRHLFPLPETLDPFSRYLFQLQRTGDSPLNCFPSLHVCTVLAAALQLRGQSGRYLFYMSWALLICLSTLTTKQHYLWDVLGGAALTGLAHFIFRSTPAAPESIDSPIDFANPVRPRTDRSPEDPESGS